MSSQVVEMTKNAKLHRWYTDIQSQKQSGLTVDDWCEKASMTRSTYYYRYKIVMRALESRLAAERGSSVQFAALPSPSSPVNRSSGESIRIRVGKLEVEIPSGASRESIAAVIEALKC
mgnify:CR=1 FL=1